MIAHGSPVGTDSATAAHTALAGLYPHLAAADAAPPDPALMQAALLASVQQKAADSVSVKQRFFADNGPAIVQAAHLLAACYRSGGRNWWMRTGRSRN